MDTKTIHHEILAYLNLDLKNKDDNTRQELLQQLSHTQFPETFELELYFSRMGDAIRKNPSGLKRKSKSTLSDGCILRVFTILSPEEEAEKENHEFLAVIENHDGKIHYQPFVRLDRIHTIFFARNPSEYVFCLTDHKNYPDSPFEDIQVSIWPKFCADMIFRDEKMDLRASLYEEEPVWYTTWFHDFYKKHLSSELEAVWKMESEPNDIFAAKKIFEDCGMVYDFDLEEYYVSEMGGKGLSSFTPPSSIFKTALKNK